MSHPLKILIVEDSEDDALLILRELRRGGFDLTWARVQTVDTLQAALAEQVWDVIISDFRLPTLDAPTALSIVQASGLDIPFIVVSGTIGEVTAVTMMKSGAHDYLMKDNLTRLTEAVRREVREALMRAERRQSERRLQQTAKREQLVRLVTERIRQSLDLEDILKTTVVEVRQVLQTDRVVLFRLQPDQPGCVIQESVAAHCDSLLNQTIQDPCLQSNYIEQYRVGQVRAIADVDDGTIQACHADFLKQFQVRANLVVPIVQPAGLWGLLIAHHCTQPRKWTEDEIELLKQVANQVAIALQQADLYRQSQIELAERQRAEQALQQLNQELEQRVQERTQSLQQKAEQERLLRLIVQNIHRSLDLNEVLPTVLRATRQTLQADRVAIYQFAADWSGHFMAESVGEGWVPLVEENPQFCQKDRVLQAIQGGYFPKKEPLAVNDIYEAGQSGWHLELLEPLQAKAYAIAPIVLDDQLWGLLVAYQNRHSRQWQAWEVSLLQQIGMQMAIALRQSHLYEAAQAQVRMLEQLSELKDDFLSTVSHELRSPLANIKMSIQMVKLSLSREVEGDDRLARYIEIMEESCTQELTLINDLLDLQRLEAGVQSMELETTDFTDWLTNLAAPFMVRTQEQQQTFHLQLAPDLPAITTDLAACKRIFVELLHNACKYTPPNEHITLKAALQNQMLHIQVINSGVELPPAELPRIFEKFYRITSIDRWKHGGTGLGLALVKRLVAHLSGVIQVESGQAQVCFTVQLPVSLPQPRPAAKPDWLSKVAHNT